MIYAVKGGIMRAVTAVTAVLERLPEAWRARGHEALWRYGVMRLPNYRVTRRYVRHFGLKVRNRQFAGLEFPKEVVGRNPFLTSKLIGSYELELHPGWSAWRPSPSRSSQRTATTSPAWRCGSRRRG